MGAQMLGLAVASLLLTQFAAADWSCSDGSSCQLLPANDLSFECRLAGPPNGTAVMLLHGFPEWSIMYAPLMRTLASHGYRTMACNQRGYSPAARPTHESDYNYNLLASDVWALADAANFSRFHLIGHDHGSMLGWFVSASPHASERVLTYTGLSVPHPAAFGSGLYGADADIDQQVASQYFTMFTMNNSATIDFELFYRTIGSSVNAPAGEETFGSAEAVQAALWWYNGAMDAGVLAMPPIFSASELLLKYKNPSMAALRAGFAGCDRCKANGGRGFPADHPVGNVSMPALFVCGTTDTSLLCTKPYALRTKEFCSSDYRYLKVNCGHEVLTVSKTCLESEVDKVTEAIIELLAKRT